LSQIAKHRLNDILGQLRVSADAPDGDRINEVHIPFDQLAKRGFVAVLYVVLEKLRRLS
jgi:hypothetical protein